MRRVLFLQGLASPFFRRLGKRLEASGAEVHKINICPGDGLFWPFWRAVSYRGRLRDWPRFIDDYIATHGITEIVLFGDCRAYHRIARLKARRRNIPVHVFEEGYLRPDWITMEREGANAHSRLPRTRRGIEALARRTIHIPQALPTKASFAHRAGWDVAASFLNTAFRFTYPFYVRHRPHHPLREGLGWLRRLASKKRNEAQARYAITGLLAAEHPLFLFPLQLDSDWQIRKHSPFSDMGEVLELVASSFKRCAPPEARLVVKVHPMDNGLVDRVSQVGAVARKLGIEDRIEVIDGGDLDLLLPRSAGVVVVNSTVGLSAMRHGRPTIALGRAFYRMKGLTFEGGLDAFWKRGKAPDPSLVSDLWRVLMSEALINGGFFSWRGIELGVENAALRLAAGSAGAVPAATDSVPSEAVARSA